MAITVTDRMTDFLLTNDFNFRYLNEPLNVKVVESTAGNTKIYVDLELYEVDSDAYLLDLIEYKYLEYDYDSTIGFVDIDLMKLIRQYVDSDFYKIGSTNDIINTLSTNVFTKNRYLFRIYSEVTQRFDEPNVGLIKNTCIVGGRRFSDFKKISGIEATGSYAAGDYTRVLSEMEKYGVSARHRGISYVDLTLGEINSAPPYSGGSKESTDYSLDSSYPTTCGSLIWKSRYGGWCHWGFDLITKSSSLKYGGNMEVGMYEINKTIGTPYVPVNYTDISESYTIKLKGLQLSKNELKVLDGLNASPAIYYQEPNSENLELMRLTSASVPLDSMADGGDVTVTLSNISNTTIKTI